MISGRARQRAHAGDDARRGARVGVRGGGESHIMNGRKGLNDAADRRVFDRVGAEAFGGPWIVAATAGEMAICTIARMRAERSAVRARVRKVRTANHSVEVQLSVGKWNTHLVRTCDCSPAW